MGADDRAIEHCGLSSMRKYKVVVREDEVVYEGQSQSVANCKFAIFVFRSKVEPDRSYRQTVTMFENHHVVKQWCPPLEY
jgi:hypothetical protein